MITQTYYERRFATIKITVGWVGRVGAIKKLSNLPFLTLKARYPAIS